MSRELTQRQREIMVTAWSRYQNMRDPLIVPTHAGMRKPFQRLERMQLGEIRGAFNSMPRTFHLTAEGERLVAGLLA